MQSHICHAIEELPSPQTNEAPKCQAPIHSQRKAFPAACCCASLGTFLLFRRGLVCAFLVLVFASSLLGCVQVYAAPSANMLVVPYHSQDLDYYCGPASVQMVIEYVSGNVIPQDTLAAELKTDPVKESTSTNNMRIPFDRRGYGSVREEHAALSVLKEQNSRGYLSILLIWSDTNHKYGHYVVVIGYNESGIFVNDPWPSYWDQPVSRKTGKSAFVSDQLLADLWTKYHQWVLEIPYPAHTPPPPAVYAITVSVSGLPQTYQSTITADGTESARITSGDSKSFDFKVGTSHMITVDQYISGSEGTRYSCSSNSWSVSSTDKHTFVYTTQYYLTVSSPYGTVSDSSWYDADSTRTFWVTPTEQSMQDLLGALGGKYVFDHWSGDSTATAPTASVTMDRPRTVKAEWRADYTIPYVIIGAIVGAIAIVVVLLFMRRRRAPRPAEEVPPLPTVVPPSPAAFQSPPGKFCMNCGVPLQAKATFCVECGSKQ